MCHICSRRATTQVFLYNLSSLKIPYNQIDMVKLSALDFPVVNTRYTRIMLEFIYVSCVECMLVSIDHD